MEWEADAVDLSVIEGSQWDNAQLVTLFEIMCCVGHEARGPSPKRAYTLYDLLRCR